VLTRHRPDDRVERDRLQTEVALAAVAQCRHHLLERQDRRYIIGLEVQARADLRQCAPAPLAREVRLRACCGKPVSFMDLAILGGAETSADDKHRERHPQMPYPAAMSRASALLAVLTSEPASTSELYARAGYMNLAQVGLFSAKS
jgi:hypothetical protein